jgi:hypothetical protein
VETAATIELAWPVIDALDLRPNDRPRRRRGQQRRSPRYGRGPLCFGQDEAGVIVIVSRRTGIGRRVFDGTLPQDQSRRVPLSGPDSTPTT